MIEWIGPILGAMFASALTVGIPLLVWRGQVAEALRQLRRDVDDHIVEADRQVDQFMLVKETQAVMRQEIISVAARLMGNDEHLKELNILARNFAVMEVELKGIRAELVKMNTSINKQAG